MIILIIALVFGLIGGFIANAKGKNVFLWFILCALFPLIGLIILLLSKSEMRPQTVYVQQAPAAPQPPTPALPSKSYDLARWNTLVEYDPELREARDRLAAYGEIYAERLAADFMSVNDKKYLASMVARIEERALADQELKRSAPVQTGKYLGYSWRQYDNGSVVGTFDEADRSFSSMQEFMSAAMASAKSQRA